MARTTAPRTPVLQVSATNLKKTALRVLNGQMLVSTELDYVMRTLGDRATQQELDTMVVQVRSMPWASIVRPD